MACCMENCWPVTSPWVWYHRFAAFWWQQWRFGASSPFVHPASDRKIREAPPSSLARSHLHESWAVYVHFRWAQLFLCTSGEPSYYSKNRVNPIYHSDLKPGPPNTSQLSSQVHNFDGVGYRLAPHLAPISFKLMKLKFAPNSSQVFHHLATSANSPQVVLLLLCDHAVVLRQLNGFLQAGSTWRYRLATRRCKFWFCNSPWLELGVPFGQDFRLGYQQLTRQSGGNRAYPDLCRGIISVHTLELSAGSIPAIVSKLQRTTRGCGNECRPTYIFVLLAFFAF